MEDIDIILERILTKEIEPRHQTVEAVVVMVAGGYSSWEILRNAIPDIQEIDMATVARAIIVAANSWVRIKCCH